MLCEFVRSPVPRRGLCWLCARLDIRDISVAKRPRVSYTCGWNPIRAPYAIAASSSRASPVPTMPCSVAAAGGSPVKRHERGHDVHAPRPAS
jgi:hypothetical protein